MTKTIQKSRLWTIHYTPDHGIEMTCNFRSEAAACRFGASLPQSYKWRVERKA